MVLKGMSESDGDSQKTAFRFMSTYRHGITMPYFPFFFADAKLRFHAKANFNQFPAKLAYCTSSCPGGGATAAMLARSSLGGAAIAL
jgi:hypothetical protein